uniref:Uncharacterized protein n=1 Tax=Anguilla anguilla TaxID=7936 RepID=A0A0E9R771_ANGAN
MSWPKEAAALQTSSRP